MFLLFFHRFGYFWDIIASLHRLYPTFLSFATKPWTFLEYFQIPLIAVPVCSLAIIIKIHSSSSSRSSDFTHISLIMIKLNETIIWWRREFWLVNEKGKKHNYDGSRGARWGEHGIKRVINICEKCLGFRVDEADSDKEDRILIMNLRLSPGSDSRTMMSDTRDFE